MPSPEQVLRPASDPTTGRAAPAPARRTVDVTAVLVVHDGERWLPEVLAALAAQTVRARTIVAVDTGSADASPALLEAARGTVLDQVVQAGRTTGFGAAVARGLAEADRASGDLGASALLWMLHDDAAPAPDVLELLAARADDSPQTALLGPKVRDWTDPRLLVEVGLSTDPAGHRETGLEPREYDQGQHDGINDVLAVGTAAALVRRSVWDELDGLDPLLPMFRDDLDLGWRVNAADHRVVVVAAATLRHARAASTGRRQIDAVDGRPHRVDRQHALHVLLTHASWWRLPLLLVGVPLAAVLRIVGFLLTKRPVEAGDELFATLAVLGRPGRIVSGHRRRRRTRRLTRRQLRPLFVSRRRRARQRLDVLGDQLAGGAGPRRAGAAVLSDPAPETSAPEPGSARGERVGGLRLRPPVLLAVALVVLTVAAVPTLLPTQGGVLAGGRLLPPPDGARDLWAAWTAPWQQVSVGSPVAAPPWVGLLAALSTVLLGKAWLAVDLLLLGAVPLGGLAAYAAAGTVTRSATLRCWAGLSWAVLPTATAGVWTGRLDVAVAQVLLPGTLVAAARLLSPGGRTRLAFGLGLRLSLLSAFAPVLWPLLAGTLLLAALVRPARGGPWWVRRVTRSVVAATVPVLLLAPWSFRLLSEPGLAVHGPGRLVPGLVDPAVAPWQLALLSPGPMLPGGAGLPWTTWLTVGLLAAAAAGLLRRDRSGPAVAGWLLALVGLAAAIGLLRLRLPAVDGGPDLPGWPGPALQLAAAGLVLAAVVGAEGVRGWLPRHTFGWRHLLAAALAAVAVASPVALSASWVLSGPEEPGPTVQRDAGVDLPVFARSELAASPGDRVLLLAPGPAGVSYDLADTDGTRLGATATPPTREQRQLLSEVVARLVTDDGSPATGALASRGVRYVLMPGADDPDGRYAAALDGREGLVRRSTGEQLLWEVLQPAARLSVLGPDLATRATTGADGPPDGAAAAGPEPAGTDLGDTDLGAPDLVGTDLAGTFSDGPPGRLLVLSEADDPGWVATVDGRALAPVRAWGWASAFVLPEGGGRVEVRHEGDTGRNLVLQVAGLLVLLALAAPGGRRRFVEGVR